MNYSRIYDNLISKAVDRQSSKSTAELYLEEHHIVPQCIGGSNDKSNLVLLTGAEHYVAHQLLVKMYPNNDKLIYAAHLMTIGSKNHRRTNKEYHWIRKQFANKMSKLHKNKIVTEETRKKMSVAKKDKSFGSNNNFYGKIHTEEFKKKISKVTSIRQQGSNNSQAKIWKIKFPDGSINIIDCLKDFARNLGVSIYKVRNNKLPGYEITENMRSI